MDESAAREIFEHAISTQEPAFGTFFLAKFLGFEISFDEEDEACFVDFAVRDYMFNPQGSLHGGIIAVALDVSMGHLIHHVTGKGGITLEMKVQYMRPAMPGPVRCTGRFLKKGRSISQMEGRMTGADGKLLAMATSTWQMPKA